MKTILTLVLITFSSLMLFAQETETKKTTDNTESMYFQEVDELPIYPGCKGDAKQLELCFSKAMHGHIAKKFHTGLANDLDLQAGKQRIYVNFQINKEGKVENIKAKAPHPVLANEGIRIVKLLPKMIPAKHKGKPVNVKYTLPITLMVDGDGKMFKTMNENEVPVFPGCDSLAINLQKKCFEDKVTAHIAKNLNKKLAIGLELEPGKKIVYARFTIDSDGKIVEIDGIGANSVLRNEAKRVVNLLPTMKPGEVKGNPISVKYYLAIDFEEKMNE